MASLGTAFGAPIAAAGYLTEAFDIVAAQVRLADAPAPTPPSPSDPPASAKPACKDLTAKEAAAYLGWKWGTFRNRAKKDKIPKLRTGRYSLKALDDYKHHRKNPK